MQYTPNTKMSESYLTRRRVSGGVLVLEYKPCLCIAQALWLLSSQMLIVQDGMLSALACSGCAGLE
jgi:hypothetical protein